MRRWVRLLLVVGVVLVVALVAASIFAVVTVRRSFPQTSGEVTVDGLAADVRVLRDEQGIPQLYADDAGDLFFAQGFVHAQDRFFEMDFRRHVTAGRLAELVGDAALDTDVYVRALGWRRTAEREVGMLDPETRRYLQAYADGVNAYLEGRNGSELSLEYAVLSLTGPDYVPEEWTPADSVAWLKAMAWDLRGNSEAETARTLALETLTPEEVEELYPRYPYDEHDPIVTSGRVRAGIFQQGPGPLQRVVPGSAARTRQSGGGRVELGRVPSMQGLAAAAESLPDLLGTGDGIGSNSWVVSGDRTESGMPLLANDPHLAPSMPGIWYQMGLHCTEVTDACPFDVAGFTFSGMPGVVIGHNDTIAWGLTTMYPDVADLYLEQVDDDAQTYLYDGEQLPLRVRTEEFVVAGQDEPTTVEMRRTRHGPLLSDLDDQLVDVGEQTPQDARTGDAPPPYAVSLRWTGSDPGRTMDAVLGINQARSWEEFRRAAALMDVPSQNLVYADVEGRIGYQAPGRVPIRRPGVDGRWPVAGWDPRNDWLGSIPYEELPTVVDPPSGELVTANNAVIGADYPYLLTSDSAYGYRSQRILDLLEDRDDLSVDDMLTMQHDTRNPMAAVLVPYLLDVGLPSFYYRQGQSLLRRWDGTQPADSSAAAYYNVVWRNLLELTFHDQLPEEVWPDGGERWFRVVEGLLEDPDSAWWDDVDTATVETRDDVLRQAMLDARDDLTVMQARNPRLWEWGRLHELTLVNATLGESGIGVVESMFNRGPYEVGGGQGTVDATGWDAAEGFEVTSLPSMRMVVDLGDLDASRYVQFGGQSGHAYSGTYTGQTDLWVAGETLAWPFGLEQVEAATEDELVLRAQP